MIYYVVTELQVINGTPAVLAQAFDDRIAAISRYYTVLAAACASSIELHGAYLTSSEGAQMMSEVFDRRNLDE